jgi:hypothetical protein
LRPWCHGPDFNEPETQSCQTINICAVLVEPCSQSYRIGEGNSHYITRGALRWSEHTGQSAGGGLSQHGKGKIVSSFRIEREKQRAYECIEGVDGHREV